MPERQADWIIEARQGRGRFRSVADFHDTTGLPVATLRTLAEADAFGSIGLSRRQALWEVLRLKDEVTPLFERAPLPPLPSGEGWGEGKPRKTFPYSPKSLSIRPHPNPLPGGEGIRGFPSDDEPHVSLPTMPLGQEVMTDYSTVRLSLKQHPVALVREELAKEKIISSAQLEGVIHGKWVRVAGLVLIRQRPGTASGIVFETLEDETGIVNLIVKPDIYDRYRPAARHAGLLRADGYVQRSGQVVHVLAKRLFDLSHLLNGYELRSRDFH